MRPRRAHLFAIGVLVGALALPATAALAGTGIGAVLNLGRTNTVNHVTTVQGSTTARLVQITNNGSGSALKLTVKPGSAPLEVSSATRVANLNADKLDGLDSTAFRKSADPVDAATLDGLDSTAFRKSADPVDAATLDGLDSAAFRKSGDPVDAATLDGLDSTAFRKTADPVNAATLGGLAPADVVQTTSGSVQEVLRGRLAEPLNSGNGAILAVPGFGSIEGSCGSGGIPNYRLFWRNSSGATADVWFADSSTTTTYASPASGSGAYVAPLDQAADRIVTVTAGLATGASATVIVAAHAGATGCVFYARAVGG